jgi:hypothetical protein
MTAKKLRNLGLNSLRQQLFGSIAQHFCQSINTCT